MKSPGIARAVLLALLLCGVSYAKAAGPIRLSFRAATYPGGTSIDVPIYVDSTLTGAGVTAYQIEFTYSNSQILFLDSASVTGTLTQSWGLPTFQEISPGRIRIAGAGTTALSGTGPLVILRFKTFVSQYWQYPGFNYQSVLLNEGTPATVTSNANLTISPINVVVASPDAPVLVRGEQQQYTAGGGTAPYSWSTLNPSVATISPTGLLSALTVGSTRVVCTDFTGSPDTTTSVEVRGMRISLRDTSRFQGQTLDLPVYTTSLTGLNITSGQVRIAFNTSVWIPQGVIQTGTLTASWGNMAYQPDANGVTVSFAGTTPLSGSGILFYLRVDASTATSGYITFVPQNVLFNENLLAVTQYGNIQNLSRPAINITPSSPVTMMTGDSLQFTASGGFAPYTWTISNPAKGLISSTGWLKARRGGTVTVTATDAVGGTGTSNAISIYDVKLSLMDTVYAGKGTVEYPIRITSNDTGFTSFQFVLGYPTFNFVKLQGINATGTLTDGWTAMTSPLPATNGNVTIAGATSGSALLNGGLFLKLVFQIPDTAVRPSYLTMTLGSVLLNEGYPRPLLVNGSISLSGTVSVEPKPEIPSGFSLGQNYPNPFNPSTNIPFTLPQRSDVSVRIMDVLGRELDVLVRQELGSGSYQVRWNAGSQPSGMYLCRLEARPTEGSGVPYSETRKLLLLK